jgi:hypothetical protein
MKKTFRPLPSPLAAVAIVACGLLAVSGPAWTAAGAEDDKAFHDHHHGEAGDGGSEHHHAEDHHPTD